MNVNMFFSCIRHYSSLPTRGVREGEGWAMGGEGRDKLRERIMGNDSQQYK